MFERYLLKIVLGLFLVGSLAGCWRSLEDELLDVGRCYKAGRHLEDEMLRVAASLEMKKITRGKENPGGMFAAQLNQQLNDEIYPRGNSTSLDVTIKTLRKWQKSSYCQGLVEKSLRE